MALSQEEQVLTYIQKYSAEGHPDRKIRDSLLKSGVSETVVDLCFLRISREKERRSLRRWFFVLLVFFFLLLVFFTFFFSQKPETVSCVHDSDCPTDTVCSSEICVAQVGLFQCQVEEDCERGYDCYSCLEP